MRAGILWTLFYDTIYAHQDREDDALIGVRSTARLFGTADRGLARRGFLAGATALAAAAAVAAGLSGAALVAALAGVAAFALHLGWQLRRLDIDDPAGCLALFRSNRDCGLLLAAGLVAAAIL